MSVFPGANARVYYNEAGEPLGWDYPSDDPPDPAEYDPDPWDDNPEADSYQPYCGVCGSHYVDGLCNCETCDGCGNTLGLCLCTLDEEV